MMHFNALRKHMNSLKDYETKYPTALLATGGFDHSIFIWHPRTGDVYKKYDHTESQVNCLKFSDDGKLLAVTGYEVLRVYDVHSNSPLTVMSNNPDKNSKNITCVAFDRTEFTRLITGGEDGFCRVWDFPKRNLKHAGEKDCSEMGVINCLSTKHRHYIAVLGTQLGHIIGWRVEDNSIDVLYSKKGISINSIDCYSSDNEIKIAAITMSGQLLYCYKGEAWLEQDCHYTYGLTCTFSADGNSLATGGTDGRIKLFGLEKNKIFQLQEFSDSKLKWVWDLQFSDDKKFLFVASNDGIVQMWNIDDKIVKRTYRGHQKTVVSLSLFQQSCDPLQNVRI